MGEEEEIPEGILAEFREEGKLSKLEDFLGGPAGEHISLKANAIDRMFAYIVMNHLEEILAIVTEKVAESLQDMAKILGPEITRTYPGLANKAEVSGAACAAFLTGTLDGVVKKSYDVSLSEVICKPLAERFAQLLAKSISSPKMRKELLARFKPDLAGFMKRGIDMKLGVPEKIVGNRVRAEQALADCIEKYLGAKPGGAEQAKAEQKLADLAKKSLDTHLPRLMKRAWEDALLAELLAEEIVAMEMFFAEGDGGPMDLDQSRPDMAIPPKAPQAKGFDGEGPLNIEVKRNVRIDIGMRKVKRLIHIRNTLEAEKIAALREKPARPVVTGRGRIRQRGVPRDGSAYALTPKSITKDKERTTRRPEPVPPPVISVRFGRATRRVKPLKIDGDLKDWDRAYPLVPRNARMFKDFRSVMYMKWDPDNVYIAGEVKLDHDKITMRDPKQFWLDDCVEFWIDSKNTKLSMEFPRENHHFVFTPPDKVPAVVGQIKYGNTASLGVAGGSVYYKQGQMGIQWATKTRKGYFSFEIKLPRGTELREFEPYGGNYVGFNYIASSGVEHRLYWASDKMWDNASAATYVWVNPSIWGDVELVGVEAEVRSVTEDYRATQRYVDLGRPIYVRIRDADMNLNSAKREFVNAMVTCAATRDEEPLTLYESSPSSGVFIGSIRTAHVIDPSEIVRGDGTLFGVEGEFVEIAYTDISRESGARNVRMVEKLPTLIPVALLRKK